MRITKKDLAIKAREEKERAFSESRRKFFDESKEVTEVWIQIHSLCKVTNKREADKAVLKLKIPQGAMIQYVRNPFPYRPSNIEDGSIHYIYTAINKNLSSQEASILIESIKEVYGVAAYIMDISSCKETPLKLNDNVMLQLRLNLHRYCKDYDIDFDKITLEEYGKLDLKEYVIEEERRLTEDSIGNKHKTPTYVLEYMNS